MWCRLTIIINLKIPRPFFYVSCFRKKIYLLIPFKQSVYTVVRKFWQLPESIYQHLHFHGVIQISCSNNERGVLIEHRGSISENILFWEGLDGWYERTSIKLWLDCVRNSSIIVDVGANSGLYSLLAAIDNPEAKVIAFEPIPDTFEWLSRNIALNRLDIRPEALAVSNSNGFAEIWLFSPGSHYTPSLFQAEQQTTSDGHRISVQTTTLDNYFAEQSLQHVDLIKIDVERHEPAVLQGMRNLLTKYKPVLIIEVLDDETGKLIEHELLGLGYLYFNIHEPSGSVRRAEHITKADTYNYLCLQPEQLSVLGLVG